MGCPVEVGIVTNYLLIYVAKNYTTHNLCRCKEVSNKCVSKSTLVFMVITCFLLDESREEEGCGGLVKSIDENSYFFHL